MDISSRASRDEQNSTPCYDGGRADGGAAFVLVVIVIAFSVVIDGAAKDRHKTQGSSSSSDRGDNMKSCPLRKLITVKFSEYMYCARKYLRDSTILGSTIEL